LGKRSISFLKHIAPAKRRETGLLMCPKQRKGETSHNETFGRVKGGVCPTKVFDLVPRPGSTQSQKELGQEKRAGEGLVEGGKRVLTKHLHLVEKAGYLRTDNGHQRRKNPYRKTSLHCIKPPLLAASREKREGRMKSRELSTCAEGKGTGIMRPG